MGFPVANAGGLPKFLLVIASIAIALVKDLIHSLLHSLRFWEKEDPVMSSWTFQPEIEAAFYSSLQDDDNGEDDQSSTLDAIQASLPSLPFERAMCGRHFHSNSGDCGGGSSDDSTQCAVCLSELCDGEEVRRLPHCSHVFHKGCIDGWIHHRQRTCPLCRASLVSAGSMAPLALLLSAA